MTLQWVSADLLTGEVICDLPTILSEDPFRRVIGQYQTSTATLTIPADGSIDPNWERGILEGGAVICAYEGDPGFEIIQWAGIVLSAPRSVQSNQIPLQLITVEGYLDRCDTVAYTTDPGGTGATKAQNQIVADIVQLYAGQGGAEGALGLPIRIVQLPEQGTNGNVQRNVTYYDYDDTTLYTNLQALMGMQGGPEWTMTFEWTHNPERITPVFYVGTRIGSKAPADGGPAVVFDETICLDGTITRDYSTGKGANHVTTTGSSTGLGRTTGIAAAPSAGRPRWSYKYNPAATSDPAVLTSFAQAAAAAMGNGAQSVSITIPNGLTGFQLGVDWNMGDDVGYSLQSLTIPRRQEAVTRCVGYELTQTTQTPIMQGALT